MARERFNTPPVGVRPQQARRRNRSSCIAAGSHLIIRTSWIYASSGNSFLQKIIRRADDDEELRVVSDQIGAPTSARSIAEAVSHIVGGHGITIESRFKLLDGIVHIANSGSTSRHGFAIAILDGLVQRGIVPAAKPVASTISTDTPMTARRPLNSRLDLTRLENTLGLKMADWRTALSDELDLLKSDSRGPRPLNDDLFERQLACRLQPVEYDRRTDMCNALVRHQDIVDDVRETLEIAEHDFEQIVCIASQRIGFLDVIDRCFTRSRNRLALLGECVASVI